MSIVEFKYKATAVVATCPVLAVRISWVWAIRLYVSHYPRHIRSAKLPRRRTLQTYHHHSCNTALRRYFSDVDNRLIRVQVAYSYSTSVLVLGTHRRNGQLQMRQLRDSCHWASRQTFIPLPHLKQLLLEKTIISSYLVWNTRSCKKKLFLRCKDRRIHSQWTLLLLHERHRRGYLRRLRPFRFLSVNRLEFTIYNR